MTIFMNGKPVSDESVVDVNGNREDYNLVIETCISITDNRSIGVLESMNPDIKILTSRRIVDNAENMFVFNNLKLGDWYLLTEDVEEKLDTITISSIDVEKEFKIIKDFDKYKSNKFSMFDDIKVNLKDDDVINYGPCFVETKTKGYYFTMSTNYPLILTNLSIDEVFINDKNEVFKIVFKCGVVT